LLAGVVAADPARAEALELELDPSAPKDSTLIITRDIWLSPECEDIVTNAGGFIDDDELITAAHLLLSLSYSPVIAHQRIGSSGATAESLRERIRAFARIAAWNEIRAAPVPGDSNFKSSRTLLDPRASLTKCRQLNVLLDVSQSRRKPSRQYLAT